jgi:hypothetical protein
MTSKKIFGLAAALLLSVLAAGGLSAQTPPHDFVVSPQSTASEGRYRSDADNFIRTDSYSGVKFDKFYAYTSFYPAPGTGAVGNRAALGFATKFGETFVSAYYSGNFWSGTTGFTYTEQELNFGGSDKTFPVYADNPTFSATIPDNRVAILLGVANMGFRLSYAWTYESFKKDDFAVGEKIQNPDYIADPNDRLPGYEENTPEFIFDGNFYKNYQMGLGVIAPQIEWAMAKAFTDRGIQPKITLNLNFFRNYAKVETYVNNTNESVDERIANSQNYFNPHLLVNVGGFHVYNQNGFRATVDLDYELNLRLYNNEYSYSDDGGRTYKIDKIKGLNNNDDTYSENSYIRNLVTPSLAGQWSGENLALRFKLNLPLRFTNQETATMTLNNDSKMEQNGADRKTSEFQFAPNLRLAAQWKAVPDKLHLYAGGRLNLGNITRTTTETSTYTAGKEDVNNSTKTIANDFEATNNALKIGVTFLPIENLTFEAACGIGTNNSISVFDWSGLLNFTTLLVSLKF